ncbi:hypothetical protein ACNANV_06660 [Curtobacterium flaccumfaciens pv. flaccumfaciens]|uniref:hypothetical protein n=1 Tax=Curtobacterium flaccumfaciens TaxID=2035 RepID=UPI003A4E2068
MLQTLHAPRLTADLEMSGTSAVADATALFIGRIDEPRSMSPLAATLRLSTPVLFAWSMEATGDEADAVGGGTVRGAGSCAGIEDATRQRSWPAGCQLDHLVNDTHFGGDSALLGRKIPTSL